MRPAVLLLLAALVLASCGGGKEASSTQAEPTAGVQELENVLALRAEFEADAGKTRAILLFSPT